MEWKLFANLAEAAGSRTVTVDLDGAEGATVGDAVDALVAARPALADLVVEDGDLRGHLSVTRNGEPATVDEPVAPDDELALFPPVSGG